MIKYSIIIPHYNCPQLLCRLLKTIPQRDDTEVIVVDDNSSQDNVAKLKELERQFVKIHFIFSKENGGGGKSRNIGINHATGIYLLFADSDDYFNVCLNDILDDYKDETVDMIMFGSNSVDSDTYQNSNRANLYAPTVNKYDGANDFDLRYNFGVPWSRMVRKALVINNNIKFQETIRHNDVGFAYLVGYYAKTIKADKRAIYCVTTREGSVSTNESYDAMKDGLMVYIKKHKFLLSKGIDLGYPFYFSYSLYNMRHKKEQFNQCLNYILDNGYNKQKVLLMYWRFRVIKFLGKIKMLVC